MGNILLYYKYVSIDQPEAIKQWQMDNDLQIPYDAQYP